MEQFSVAWIQHHLDMLKYFAIAVGWLYAYYRRIRRDYTEDHRQKQTDDLMVEVGKLLAEIRLRSDTSPAELTKKLAGLLTDHDETAVLQDNVTELRAAVERLTHQLAELTASAAKELPAPLPKDTP
jgi:polyhydroxyalkanoate synthesis regulator phasin